MKIEIIRKALSPHPDFPSHHYVAAKINGKLRHYVCVEKTRNGTWSGLLGYDRAETFEEEGEALFNNAIRVRMRKNRTPREIVAFAMAKQKAVGRKESEQ